jgi:hypothetical protein
LSDAANRWACGIDGGGFTTYEAARLAGSRALTEFLEQLELESFRID